MLPGVGAGQAQGAPIGFSVPSVADPIHAWGEPTIGVDPYAAAATPYDAVEKKILAPASSDASIAHGDSLFHTICWTCHGKTMAGDGPVAAKFVPPPDLLGESSRGRTDGFMYMYMRHGGAIMPSYGNVLSSSDAWSLVHYIRHMQKTSPR